MRKIGLFMIAAMAVGCSKSEPTVSMSARSGSSKAVSAQQTPTPTPPPSPVTIKSVKLVVRSVELERVANPQPGTTGNEEELEMGPFVIELNEAQLASGQIVSVFDSQVPAGTYEEIEFEIHKITAEDVKAHPEFEPMLNKSIVVTGVGANGPFTFEASIDEEQENEGPFVIGGGEGGSSSTNNITLNIDTTQWFTGTNMDPSVQGFDQAAIEKAIKASIDICDDDDKNGVED